MRIYRLDSQDGETLSFHATKREAEAERRWWSERENHAEIIPLDVKPTREGIVAILNKHRGVV